MQFSPYSHTKALVVAEEKSIVVGRGDLAWPKLRTVSSFPGRDRETRVSPTTRRKGNGVTCESSGTRNVFAKTGGSCGGGPDVFTTRIRLYKTVPVFLYRAFPSTSPSFPLPLPLPPLSHPCSADFRLRFNVDTMRSAETKNS